MTWTYSLAVRLGEIQGRYVLLRDGDEVGMLSFLDSVQHQSVIVATIVDTLNEVQP